MNNTINAAIYIRVACAGIDDFSLEAQTRSVTQFAIGNGFSDSRYYSDNGASGATLNRPGMNALMADIRDGAINTVIVKDFSRLARGMQTFIEFYDFVRKYDVKVISMHDGNMEDSDFPAWW